MGLDFATDFYNVNHVNPYGAEKYTRFLADYIQNNYNLKDHRSDSRYELWNEMYNQFNTEDQSTKSTIDSIIQSKLESNSNGKQLSSINDSTQWGMNIWDENYVILAESQGASWKQTTVSNKILNMFNIPVDNSSNAIRIYKGSNSLYESNDVLVESYKANFDGHSDYKQSYEINCGTNSSIVIDKTENSKKYFKIEILILICYSK